MQYKERLFILPIPSVALSSWDTFLWYLAYLSSEIAMCMCLFVYGLFHTITLSMVSLKFTDVENINEN